MSKVPLTAEGAETLREELHELKSERRPKVIQARPVSNRVLLRDVLKKLKVNCLMPRS